MLSPSPGTESAYHRTLVRQLNPGIPERVTLLERAKEIITIFRSQPVTRFIIIGVIDLFDPSDPGDTSRVGILLNRSPQG